MVLVKHHIKLVKTFLNFKLIIMLKVYPCPCLWRETFPLFLRNRRLIQMKLSLGWILWISWFDESCRFCNKRTLPPRLSVYEERPASEGLHKPRGLAVHRKWESFILKSWGERERVRRNEDEGCMYCTGLPSYFRYLYERNFHCVSRMIPLKWQYHVIFAWKQNH
jgi:hypothetical protein